MPSDPRVLALLEEMLDSGRSPEEVCRDCPDLLPAVRERWARFGPIDAELGALFPERGAAAEAAVLPDIPGYEVAAVLGRGGMGVVYEARHVRLNRPVALKMLLSGPYARPEERDRFRREAEAVAGLSHPHVVPVFDSGEHDGRPYFTMERMDGGTLARKLSGTPLPAPDAAALVADLTDAVRVAHESGIVHRDLKPSNVLLAADGTPKVSDFGLARRADESSGLTRTGVAVGTPSYMSPCQARGDRSALGPSTDIYALGAILYECLTGRPPFKAESSLETLQQVLTRDPVPPSRLNARVPRDLETICLKCLEKEPRKRYASAAALADDLRRFGRGEPIAARPLGPVGRAARWARRRPTAAALSGSLVLAAGLVLALVGGGLWVDGQRRATARAAGVDLDEADRLLHAADLTTARAALERARGRLGAGGPPGLRDRLAQTEQAIRERAEQIEQTRVLTARLDGIRLNRAAGGLEATNQAVPGRLYDDYRAAGRANRVRADREYEAEFRAAGLGTVGEDPGVVAARVGASPAGPALVAALDDWLFCTDDPGRRAWVAAVARTADPHPWRDRVRDPGAWADRARLDELAASAPPGRESVQLLVTLGEWLQAEETPWVTLAFLRKVQEVHPTDFYANFLLGNILFSTGDFRAADYFRAATVPRPDAAVTWYELGAALAEAGRLEEAAAALGRCLRLDPNAGWAHARLGDVRLRQGQADAAVDHLRQARRLCPPRETILGRLAGALQAKKLWTEAIDCCREAVAAEPENAWSHYDLGRALRAAGRADESIEPFRAAVARAPDWVALRTELGAALLAAGRPEEAVEHLRAVVAKEPANWTAQGALRTALFRLGRAEEGRAAWEKGLRAGPPDHDPWFGYAELCLYLGNEDEYRQARRDLLARFRHVTRPQTAERVSRACLLLPGTDDELRQAAALADRAVAAKGPGHDWARPYFHFSKGLAEYRGGRFDDALATMTGPAAGITEYLGPSARLVEAMALFKKGRAGEARAALAAAVAAHDWSTAKADNRDAWVAHVLRREAEALIGPVARSPSGRAGGVSPPSGPAVTDR